MKTRASGSEREILAIVLYNMYQTHNLIFQRVFLYFKEKSCLTLERRLVHQCLSFNSSTVQSTITKEKTFKFRITEEKPLLNQSSLVISSFSLEKQNHYLKETSSKLANRYISKYLLPNVLSKGSLRKAAVFAPCISTAIHSQVTLLLT